MRYFITLVLPFFVISINAAESCGDDYDKCLRLLEASEKAVKKRPYDINKSYPKDYPINQMFLIDEIVVNFIKKVPKNFKADDRNLILSIKAWGFYNKMLPVDFFSIAPLKRLWCDKGKIKAERIKLVASKALVGNKKLIKKFSESIRECGTCKNTKMCDGP